MKVKGTRAIDEEIWAKLLDTFDAMANGLDEHGEPLFIDAHGNQWSFILLFGCGDTEQLCIGWGLASYNDNHEICGLCRANRTDILFTDLQDDALWISTYPLEHEVSPSIYSNT